MRPLGTQKQLEERRKKAIDLLSQPNCGIRETARRVHASPSSVVRWRNAYKKYGEKALQSKKPPSRPCRLTQKQLQRLQISLLKITNNDQNKLLLLSLPEISQLIQRRFWVRYQPSSIWYMLLRMGWSHKKIQGKSCWLFKN
jgi:transposase